MLCSLLLVFALLWPARAFAAQPTITVRSGDHPGFGRVVFDLPPNTIYRLTREDDRISVRFDPEQPIGSPPKPPHNVRTVLAGDHDATLVLLPNVTVQDWRLGDHLVIDVFDPKEAGQDRRPPAAPPSARPQAAETPPAKPNTAARPEEPRSPAPEPAASTAPAKSVPRSSLPDSKPATPAAGANPPESKPAIPAPGASSPDAKPAAPAPTVSSPEIKPAEEARPAEPVAERAPARAALLATDAQDRDPGPLALVARLLPVPDGAPPAFALPFPPGTGAAAFRRGDTEYLVFDDRRPLDLRLLRGHKVFGRTSVHLLPAATLVGVRLPGGLSLSLGQGSLGWTVAASAEPPLPPHTTARFQDGRVILLASAPGRVVTMADPDTGATLLVGTLREPGESVAVRHRGPEFELLPSLQGVLVEALSERLALRAVPDGFLLTAEPDGLTVSPAATAVLSNAADLTRRFLFPNLPTDMLRQRVTEGLAQVASTPVLARGARRRALAIDMLALGMAPEAQSLLRVAAEEDPQEAAAPDTGALAGIAAVLADRPDAATELDDPRLIGTDEAEFWRSLRVAERQPDSPQAAASFAVNAPLALLYPPAMRDRVLPIVLESMLRGGQVGAATALLAQCGDLPGLDLVRAMAIESSGNPDAALAGYDMLATSRDQRMRARAAASALELRLRLGRISVQQAAEGLDRLLFAWRGDRHDLRVRERLAALRQQQGNWRDALTLLRQAERDFPTARAEIRTRLRGTFTALLRDGAADRLPPLEMVTLADENTDLLSGPGESEALLIHLADRLLALDLPQRAGPVLEKLMAAAPSATGRATVGARLSALRLREGDAGGAIGALVSSASSELPAGLAEHRRLLFAAATARRGDFSGALAAITDLDSADAAAARADIMEQAQDWPGADRALAEYVAKTVPMAGALNESQQRTLLRLAAAAVRAGDAATLNGLKARDAARMGDGALADMFRLLTAAPVQGSSDLPRARREVGFARALPAGLKAIQADLPAR